MLNNMTKTLKLVKHTITSEIQQYLSNANVTTTTNKGEATRILGMIGVEAEAWDALTSDATKNATGSETYRIIMVDSVSRLSLIPGLTRAVPWEYVDPSSIVELFSGLMRTITSFIQAAYNALINTIATIASIAKSIAAGIASAIMRGVAMLKAGIMAMANFIVNLMKDFTLMLREFGQWVLGVIQSVVDAVVSVFRDQVLYWLSWVWGKAVQLVLWVSRSVLSVFADVFSVDYGRIKILPFVYEDKDLSLGMIISVQSVTNVSIVGNAWLDVVLEYVDLIGVELWCLVGSVNISFYDLVIRITFSQTMGLPVRMSYNISGSKRELYSVDKNYSSMKEGEFLFRGIEYGWEIIKTYFFDVVIISGLMAYLGATVFGAVRFLKSSDPASALTGLGVYLSSIVYGSIMINLIAIGYSFIFEHYKLYGGLVAILYALLDIIISAGIMWFFIPFMVGRSKAYSIFSLLATVLGSIISFLAFRWLKLKFAGETLSFLFTIMGIFRSFVSVGIAFFNDGEVIDVAKKMGLIALLDLAMIALLVVTTITFMYIEHKTLRIHKQTDLTPPGIVMDSISIDTTQKTLSFQYTVDDTQTGNSDIKRTEVYLYRTPINNEDVDPSKTINLHDQESGIDYKIEISLKDVDGKKGTEDDNGLVEVAKVTMEGLGKEYIEGDVKVMFSGHFDFEELPVYPDCRYYLLVVAVDYWGNARWKFFDVTEYVLELAGSSGVGGGGGGGEVSPDVWSNNVVGKAEPRFGLINHYFALGGVAYVPWLEDAGEYAPGFSLVIRSAGRNVSIPELNISDDGDLVLGIFVLRYWDLWGLGKLSVVVGGWKVVVSFVYSPSILDLLIALIPLVILVFVGVRREHD